MTTEEVIISINPEAKTITEQIEALKQRSTLAPDIAAIKKEYDPKGHLIFDKSRRPDKQLKKVNDSGAQEPAGVEFVNRIAISMQKLIVKRAASFLFGNPVMINSLNKIDESTQKGLDALKRVLRDNKDLSLNKRVAREMFRCTEVAELWYPVESPNQSYDFPSQFRLKSMILSPFKGDMLFPVFDETGDMISFSREFVKSSGDKKKTIFESYTSDSKTTWEKNDGKEWLQTENIANPIGKIPIVYGMQEETEWSDVQGIIERLEKLLSNFSDTIDYHSAPTIFVQGSITGFAKKGESGKILEADIGADAKYLSWDQAPDAVKLEIENNLRMIFSLTQTPDISFEGVKGIGNVSGVSLKLMFLDAHLKVEDKKEIFIEYLQRRFSIILAYLGSFNSGFKTIADKMEIEPEITPYMIDDEKTLIENLSSALGGKSFISRKTAVKTLGWAEDLDEEMTEINNEEMGGLEP